ncbi:ABC transporter substrate-binding protein [Cystobacter ferrugineus]|uniref:ABC transporter substrate-binding protein n=2 Tax=Cystobacter ferrugineus TaxID=83449 RepID=A0A1L9AUY1_9BACT|nr:ABC transporter substrate-binding protein [Cystobacter ferrugineus]OJH33818.1 ABC transporter substrate-binding protein [Cystobacter ferrugineus]
MPPSRFASALSRRHFMTWALGTGAAAALGGCQESRAPRESKDSKVTLTFWNGFTGGDGAYIKKLVEQFNQATPGIQVKMNIYLWADFFQKVPGAVISGQAPDVCVMHLDGIPTNAARGIIMPMDDLAQALGLKASDYTSQEVWQGGLYKGRRYGIPFDMHPLGMYYNKGVLRRAGLDPEKPPRTGDEYMAALEQLKGKGIQGHWMAPFLFTGTFQFESLLWQFGGELFDPGVTRATFDSDAGVRALTWLVDLVKKGYSPPNVGQDADFIAFQNGQNAFNWNGIWQLNALDEVPGLEWGAAPIPRIGPQEAVWGNSHQFVLMRQRSPDPRKLEAARTFIQWMSQRSVEWLESGKIPVLQRVAESPEFKSLEMQGQFARQAPYIRFPPAVAGISDALALVDKAVNQAVLGKASPADALKAAAAQATQVVRDNHEKYGD